MTRNETRTRIGKGGVAAGVVGVVMAVSSGCTSPPSVTPLLHVAEQAMRDEAQRLAEDAERDTQQVEQVRASLTAGFEADLHEREVMDVAWVADAAEVYAAAREALARHEMRLHQQREQRATNLHLAADATARARRLLDRQDALILDTVGTDLWRWLQAPTSGEPAAVTP